ncbi:MAG: S9 family peptidase, partial [Acidobacteria bacterium]|nr:S9 family peptidase [Acidobacteriota bacterium]
YDKEKEIADLWLVPADGSAEPKRLTSTKTGESGVAWSPDSRRLAFSAKREGDEQSQIYVLDLSGGEAVRYSNAALGARSPEWSPDGSKLLFISGSYPDAADDEANLAAAKERKDRKANVRIYDSFPIRRWDRWIDEIQTRLLVADAKPGAAARDLLAGTELIGPGFGGAPAGGSSEGLQPVWAPDGKSIVFAATRTRNRLAYDSSSLHLFQASVAGGEPVQLTSGTADFSNPQFSPDGKELCFTTSDEYRKIYALNRIGCASWPWKGDVRVITAQHDRSSGDWSFMPDGKSILFGAEDAGLVKLYRVPVRGGKVELAVEPPGGVYSGLEVAGTASRPVLVANWGSSVQPNEVVRIDPVAKSHKLITRFTVDDAAKLSWQPPRHFWFTNEEGMQ